MATWRSTFPHMGADLRDALLRGLLESERRRAALAALLFLLLAALLVVVVVVPGAWPTQLQVPLRRLAIPFALLFLGMLLYELLLRRRIGHLLATHSYPSATLRYVNVLVEVSLPSVILLLLADGMGLLQALSSPAPFLYPLLVFLSVLYLDPWLCLFGGAVAALQFGSLALTHLHTGTALNGIELLSDPSAYHVKCALLLATGAAAAFVTLELRRQLESTVRNARQRDHAVSIFGQHVSPQIAERLLQQESAVVGEEKEACVMFLDIRDFSGFAAHRTPAEVMQYLNDIFSPLMDVVSEHRGIVNKFLGDGFMAVFGAPVDDADCCRHAVQAARRMLRRIEAMNEAGVIPPTRLGIGLHAGRLVTGNVGASERKEYTLIGDTVNTASRIEQATKHLDARLLVSEQVLLTLGPDPDGAEDLGMQELKGRDAPLHLYRLA